MPLPVSLYNTANNTCVVPQVGNGTVRCEGGHPIIVPDLGVCEIVCDEGFQLSDHEMGNMTCEVGEGGFEALPTCDREYEYESKHVPSVRCKQSTDRNRIGFCTRINYSFACLLAESSCAL